MCWFCWTLPLLIPLQMKIFDFSKQSILDWTVVDDSVMGGRSSGHLDMSESGLAIFHGEVSLENNGGFTSIRYRFSEKHITDYHKICIRIKGDGKSYKVRIKEHVNDRYSFVHIMKTSTHWQTIEIPFNKMIPWYRGTKLDAPEFSGEQLSEVAFLIANKQTERFKLEIDKIVLK